MMFYIVVLHCSVTFNAIAITETNYAQYHIMQWLSDCG